MSIFSKTGIRNLGGWNVVSKESFSEEDLNSLRKVEVRNSIFNDANGNPKKNIFFTYASGERYSVALSGQSEVVPELGELDYKSLNISLLTLRKPGEDDIFRIDLENK